jgi:hypothetical protein
MLELGINILSTNCLVDMISTFYKDKAYIYIKDIYNKDIYNISYRNGLYNIANIANIANNTSISSRITIFTAIKQNGLYKTNINILSPKGIERNLAILSIQSNKQAIIKL